MAATIPFALIWACAKLVLSDKTVNTAIDHWAKGTSNKFDDLVWRLLEMAAGIPDHDLKVLALEAGVADLNAQYASAKKAGREAKFFLETKPPISQKEIISVLALEPGIIGNC